MSPSVDQATIDRTLSGLTADRPRLHVGGDRQLTDYGVDEQLIHFLRTHVQPGHRTIETGSGLSTIALLTLGAEHTAVSPDAGEPVRIRAYCEAHGISTATYSPIVGGSETVLPNLPAALSFDLALVDGNHAFPAPAIDWFYLTRALKRGGITIIDDVPLWRCRIVADFLDAEDVWQRLIRTPRLAAFRLLQQPEQVLSRWFGQQPYVVRHSDGGLKVAVRRRARRLGERILAGLGRR